MRRKESIYWRKITKLSLLAAAFTAVPMIVTAQTQQDSISWEKQLATVTVKGTRSHIRQKNGAIVTRVAGTTLEQEPTVMDILAKLPGIENKDGKIQATVGGTAEIYINDRKIQDYSEVENLPVSQIKEVKVIHHPGAEYSSKVGCVLLIVTKKSMKGLSLVAFSQLGFDHHVSNRHNIDVTYNQGRLTYYGKLGYSNPYSNWTESDITTRYTHDGKTYRSTSVLECKKMTKNDYIWNVGMDYALAKNHTIGMKYDGYSMKQKQPFSMDSYTEVDDVKEDEVTGYNKYLFDDRQHHVNAFYVANFSEQWQLNAFADYVDLHTEQGQYLDETSKLQGHQQFFMKPQTDNTVWSGKVRFDHIFNEHSKCKFGGEYNYIKSDSRLDYQPIDKGTATHIITKENNAAAFAEYSLDFKPFSLTMGLRYEHVRSDLKDVLYPEQSLFRTYNNLFPSLEISHSVGRFSQTLSYRSTMVRPTFEELGLGASYINRYLWQVGNAKLEPAKRYELQYIVTYGDIFLQTSYMYETNHIAPTIEPYEDDQQMDYFSWRNIARYHEWAAVLGAQHRWGWYEPQIEGAIHQGILKGVDRGKSRTFNEPYCTAKVNNAFHLPGGFLLRMDWSYRSSGVFDYCKNISVYWFTFSLNKSFGKNRLTLYVKFNDPFNNIKMGCDGMFDILRFQNAKTDSYRNFQVRLTYRFNKAKKHYRGENSAEGAVERMAR